MYGYIYKTTNLVDGLIYIGQKHSDVFLGNSYLGSGKLIRRAVEKYGKENFKVELLEEVDTKEKMDEREIHWISFFHSTDHTIGYNISEGGNVNRTMVGENNPFYGKTHTPEAIKKIKDKNIGHTPWNKNLDKNTDNRILEYSKKLKYQTSVTKDTIWINNGSITKMVKEDKLQDYLSDGWTIGRLNLPKENYGKAAKNTIRVNKDGIEKSIKPDLLDKYLSDGWTKGRVKFKDTSKFGKHMMKPVVCLETGIIYESIKQVKDLLKINCLDCCKGRKETAGGYHWQYYTKREDN